MRKVLLSLAIVTLIPGMLMAYSTLGLYNTGKLHYDPAAPYVPFKLQLYIVHTEYFVTAVEYQIVTPTDVGHALFLILSAEYPPNMSVEMGDPFNGHSITFWPPMTGYPEGYDLLATYTCLITEDCTFMYDYPVQVGPHPVTGLLQGTYSPDHDLFDITGLTTILCIHEISADGDSWGAIKSLYDQ